MSWFSEAIGWASDAFVPNEIKKFISDATPNEVKSAIPNEIKTQDAKNLEKPAPAPAPVGVSTNGNAPTYDKTLLDAFNAQLAIEPKLLEANQLYQPQWLELQRKIQEAAAKNQMNLMGQLYPQSGQIEAAYQNQLRSNQLEQLRSTLPQYQQAFNALTPGYAGALQGMGQLAQQASQRANVPPALTAYEAQVGTPYGPAIGSYPVLQPQRPPGGVYPNGMAYETPESKAPVTPMTFTAPMSANQASAAAAAPTAAGVQNALNVSSTQTPISLNQLPTSGANQILGVNFDLNKMAAGLGQVQGPLAPPKAVSDAAYAANVARQNEQARVAQIASDQQKLSSIPQLTQEQAWGGAPTAQSPTVAPTYGQPPSLLQVTRAGDYAGSVGGPNLQSDLNRVNASSVGQYVGMMPGQREAAARMGVQMNKELAAGRGLTAEEQRIADQAARSAYAARGTALGPQAVGAEILNRADVSNQRYQQRIANAAGLSGAIQNIYQPALAQSFERQQGAQNYNLNAQQQAYTQAMGREALLSSTQQSAFNQALQRGQAEQQRLQAGTAIQAGQAQLAAGALGQLQQAQAPILQAYYQQPILQQTVGQAQGMGLANQQASGNSLFQPESSLAFQSAFLPYQASIALQQSQMQADAARAAGKSSATGSIISAALPIATSFLLCWVAREVYGTETGTWKVFRSWLLNEAPEWLVKAYIKHGPDIAEFIKDKPVIKSVIRRWMDSKIESYLTA